MEQTTKHLAQQKKQKEKLVFEQKKRKKQKKKKMAGPLTSAGHRLQNSVRDSDTVQVSVGYVESRVV